MKRWIPVAVAAVMLAHAPVAGGTWAEGALATGALVHLDAWPGAPVPRRIEVALGAARPFLGSGLAVHTLRLQRARSRHGWAASFEQQRSDVHVGSEAAGALQLASGAWRAGVAVAGRELRFGPEPPWRAASVRLGAGAIVRGAVRASAMWRWQQQGRSALAAAACWRAGKVELSLQLEREPGLPARWRSGVAWDAAAGVGLDGGYDMATAAITSGVRFGLGAWRIAWVGLAHPELGWSHLWILGYGR